MAAAGVAAARSVCNISPLWPDALAARVGYSFGDISACLDSILAIATLNGQVEAAHAASSGAAGASLPSTKRSLGASNAQVDDQVHGDGQQVKGNVQEESSPRCPTALLAVW